MNKSTILSPWTVLVLATVLIVAAFGLGYRLASRGAGDTEESLHQLEEAVAETGENVVWICSMHPWIRRQEPGQCPICFMDLIPVTAEEGGRELGPRELKMSPRARELAEIEVAPAVREYVTAEVRLVGKIEYDETRLGYITAWVPGRLDRLYVDYTGISVRKGDHMVSMYSPSLLTDQRSLLQAPDNEKDIYRERLLLKGLTPEQVREIEERGTPSDHITIYAPMGGIVVSKSALEGMYVETGTKIYTIADLSTVWVVTDAYESDLPWIRYGQTVAFQTDAYPGETFAGRISFIDPVLDPKTRTVQVRIIVENPDGRLKPEMLVRAVVHSTIAAGGKVMEPELAGKWISPMHPQVVKDEPGFCDVCGMPLVRAEDLGFVAVDTEREPPPLVIPASAPLITGKRAVVYVAVPGEDGVFQGRDIVLGPRAGEHYIVKDGLQEGDMVVVRGNFKVDSEIQIQGKPSMMSPEGGAPPPGHHHGGSGTKQEGSGGADMSAMSEASNAPDVSPASEAKPQTFSVPKEFLTQVDCLYAAYFDIQEALSSDDLNRAKEAARELVEAIGKVNMSLVQGEAHEAWMKDLKDLRQSAAGVSESDDITKAREHFSLLSGSLTTVARQFGGSGEEPVIRFFCPMAFANRGAYWLQGKTGVENPYFGSAMFKCGEQKEVLVRGRAEGSGEQ